MIKYKEYFSEGADETVAGLYLAGKDLELEERARNEALFYYQEGSRSSNTVACNEKELR